LDSTYGIFGDHHFPYLVSYGLTIFAIVIITNSFNLIDGIDGLAGVFSSVAITFYGIWFYLIGESNHATLCFSLVGAVLAFLIFNWEPSKIFMGDTGALLIGMLLSILTIHFINTNEALPADNSFKFSASVSTAISIIIIPLVDTVRIIIIRVSKGVSPLKADKRHIHHYLVRLGLSHRKAVLLLAAIHFVFILLAIMLSSYSDTLLLPVITILAIAFCLILDGYLLKKIN
jgi:UDP-N-acetylmuramyl pentapeptide phosphotransferase/UDP-N-acetylglucosamine-1-phosphate transferase